MNKSSEQNTVNGSAKAPDQTQSTASATPVSPFRKIERTPNVTRTAPEVARPSSPPDSPRKPSTLHEKFAAAKIPLRAASGDDDLMSKQQLQAMPSVDEIKGKWKQQVGAAKIAWGKLTEDELLKSEGHSQKLAGLVQERYAITRDEADKQIKKFFDTH
ncbi:MAG: CsbD family protein [Sinimarinibacterium sp.]